MSIGTTIAARLFKLRARDNKQVHVEAVEIPLGDGVTLQADRYAPGERSDAPRPVTVMMTPYGRGDALMPTLIAERGHQVLQVSCRGTDGSTGDWQPFVHERADVIAVLTWLNEQPWCNGEIAMTGGSYTGFPIWAAVAERPDLVKAMSIGVSTSFFHDMIYPGGTFVAETGMTWLPGLVPDLDGRGRFPAKSLPVTLITALAKLPSQRKQIASSTRLVPLDQAGTTHAPKFAKVWEQWLAAPEPDSDYWAPFNFRAELGETPPATLVSGWYDLFINSQVNDFALLQAAGRPVRLVVGPWHHGSGGLMACLARETVALLDTELGGEPAPSSLPVRLFVTGSKQWRDFAAWPPSAQPVAWHLQPDGRLDFAAALDSLPDRYRYDPHDPTPSAGGNTLFFPNAGPKDQRKRESRADVLTYTSDVLTSEATVIGWVEATLHVRSTLDHADFVVTLCDVDAKGKSTNVSDGIVRVTPGVGQADGDGGLRLDIRLNPVAHTFLSGHRIRVQVSSGAHPLYLRNQGTGKPWGSGTQFECADQEVFHDPARPSAVTLPTVFTG